MSQLLVFTTCTARKDDTAQVGDKVIKPSDYIKDPDLLATFLDTRKRILLRPEARKGERETYAFDLYIRTGQMYKHAYRDFYHELRQTLLNGAIEWYFLSGGYGVLHALEPATLYQATFNYTIAKQRNILYTARDWRPTLVRVCEHIIEHHPATPVYAFGSQDYTAFIKATHRWNADRNRIKIIESTGSAGAARLSPILREFLEAALSFQLSAFDARYPGRFVKLR